jgi:hypothetical protein
MRKPFSTSAIHRFSLQLSAIAPWPRFTVPVACNWAKITHPETSARAGSHMPRKPSQNQEEKSRSLASGTIPMVSLTYSPLSSLVVLAGRRFDDRLISTISWLNMAKVELAVGEPQNPLHCLAAPPFCPTRQRLPAPSRLRWETKLEISQTGNLKLSKYHDFWKLGSSRVANAMPLSELVARSSCGAAADRSRPVVRDHSESYHHLHPRWSILEQKVLDKGNWPLFCMFLSRAAEDAYIHASLTASPLASLRQLTHCSAARLAICPRQSFPVAALGWDSPPPVVL